MGPGGDDVGPGGNETSVLCDLLPNGDPQNRANGEYYSRFEMEVNPILIRSCGGSGCHSGPDNGFWIIDDSDPCSVPANFLTSQVYIRFDSPDNSPILSKPIDPTHSGFRVFPLGQSDPGYISIRNWLLLAF